jgi:hypothetical protein
MLLPCLSAVNDLPPIVVPPLKLEFPALQMLPRVQHFAWTSLGGGRSQVSSIRRVGQSTEEVLRRMLSYSWEQIAQLKEEWA